MAVATAVFVCTPVSAAKEYVAERFDVDAAVQPDGSLDIVEVVAFRFSGGEFTEVFRDIPTRYTDGVEIISASMDGRELAGGSGEGQVEVEPGGRRTRVLWRFPAARDATHVFALRYRLHGVVRHGDGEDWFAWQPYPREFKYPILAGNVQLTWMASARPRRQPEVDGAAASTSPLPNGVAVTVANYSQRSDDIRLTARFEPGAFPGQEPNWQRDERRADRMAPAFYAAAVMIGAATFLAMWLFFLRYRRERPEPLGAGAVVNAPPDRLPPALAGVIHTGRVAVGGPQLLATLFDLAARGAITIHEEAARFGKRFVIRRGHATPMRAHEQVLFDGLFAKDAEPRLDKAARHAAGHLRKFKRAVVAELSEAGFIDAERREGAHALGISGGVVIALAAVLLFVVILANLRLGPASVVVPLALMLAGLVMVAIGAGFSTLTYSGLAAGARWNAYRSFLRDEARAGRMPVNPQAAASVLPYVAALNLISNWRKAMKRAPESAVPAWLHSVSAGERNAVFIAVLATTSGSVHAGGGAGAGAGGAAGGGASGAR